MRLATTPRCLGKRLRVSPCVPLAQGPHYGDTGIPSTGDEPVPTSTSWTTNHGLPLPPILNPALQAARNRHKTAKQKQQSSDRTPLQRALALNPYAQALATPLRYCTTTHALLPRHELQSFITVFKPRDPVSPSEERAEQPTAGPTAHDAEPEQTHPHLVPEPPGTATTLSRTYCLGSYSHIAKLADSAPTSSARTTKGWRRLVTPDALSRYGVGARNTYIWDPAMADRILESLRREVEVHWTRWFTVKSPKAFGRVEGLESECGVRERDGRVVGRGLPVLDPDEVMCFLSFDLDGTGEVNAEVEDWACKAGLEYVQVFDLVALLGRDRATALRTRRLLFRSVRVLAVKKDSLVMAAVLALMKLDAYFDDANKSMHHKNISLDRADVR